MNNEIKRVLESVKEGSLSVDDALLKIKTEPFEDIGFAKVDLHRKIRQGAAEVIYGAGKTPEQMIGIIDIMKKNGQDTILITRLSAEAADEIAKVHPISYHKDARCGIIGELPAPTGIGKIVVATGGTSDIPVAEEAALTAQPLNISWLHELDIDYYFILRQGDTDRVSEYRGMKLGIAVGSDAGYAAIRAKPLDTHIEFKEIPCELIDWRGMRYFPPWIITKEKSIKFVHDSFCDFLDVLI